MAHLVIRPSNLHPDKPWALQLRYHDVDGTDYETLARLTDRQAHEVINAGKAHWLFGSCAGPTPLPDKEQT